MAFNSIVRLLSALSTPDQKGKPNFQKVLEGDIRKLKAIITMIIYGLFFLLLKIMYDRVMLFPESSNIALIVFMVVLLTLSVIFSNSFSRRILVRISYYTTALEEAKQYAESIVQSIQIPLLVTDEEGTILTANSAYINEFPEKPEEILGQNLLMIEQGRWYAAEIDQLLKSPGGEKQIMNDLEMEREIRGKGKCNFVLNGRRLFGESEKLFLISFLDITSRKQAEINLRHYAAKAEKANQAKTDFLANMSHELRTPLTAIIGFSEILMEGMGGELNAQQKEYMQDIMRSSRHLLSLINDILDLSKIEAGKMNLDLENLDIETILEESVSYVRPSAQEKELVLHLHAQPNLGSIHLDERKFKQILINLLANAVKYTEKGGRITLSAQKVIGGKEDFFPEFLRVIIHDTGIGISPEDMHRLFSPFEQLDGSLNRYYKGTGLGLSMVKRLVELHNGRVWVESELGKGSLFYIQVPYHLESIQDKRRQPGQERRRPTGSQTGRTEEKQNRLLVIEQDHRRTEMFREEMDRQKVNICTLSREEDIQYCNQVSIDLILANIIYPDMSGWNLLLKTVFQPALYGTPMILFNDQGSPGHGFILPIHGIFHWPSHPQEWSTIIEKMHRNFSLEKNGKTALAIVRDSYSMEIFCQQMQSKGWNLKLTQNSVTGINTVLKEKSSLVIIDLLMPEITGMEIIQLLKSKQETSDIPVVALIPLKPDIEQEIALQKGFKHIIQPSGFSIPLLLKATRQFFPIKNIYHAGPPPL